MHSSERIIHYIRAFSLAGDLRYQERCSVQINNVEHQRSPDKSNQHHQALEGAGSGETVWSPDVKPHEGQAERERLQKVRNNSTDK